MQNLNFMQKKNAADIFPSLYIFLLVASNSERYKFIKKKEDKKNIPAYGLQKKI